MEEPVKPKKTRADRMDKKHKRKGRLPDRSVFRAEYNAESEEWSGSLFIPGENPLTLHAKVSGVFKLMENLDKQYRESIKVKE